MIALYQFGVFSPCAVVTKCGRGVSPRNASQPSHAGTRERACTMSGALALDQRAQRADLAQRSERLARDRELDVLAAFGDERRHQAPAARDDDRAMTGGDERATDLERPNAPLRPRRAREPAE